MRTIKFRGRRLDNQEWEQGNYVAYKEDDGEDVHCIVSRERNQIGASLDFVPVDPETVGQFTGLFDNNGKEIYEGDKLLIKGNATAVVMWRNDGFDILDTCSSTPTNKGDIEGFVYVPTKTMEIIGNIHDNPELLKTE